MAEATEPLRETAMFGHVIRDAFKSPNVRSISDYKERHGDSLDE